LSPLRQYGLVVSCRLVPFRNQLPSSLFSSSNIPPERRWRLTRFCQLLCGLPTSFFSCSPALVGFRCYRYSFENISISSFLVVFFSSIRAPRSRPPLSAAPPPRIFDHEKKLIPQLPLSRFNRGRVPRLSDDLPFKPRPYLISPFPFETERRRHIRTRSSSFFQSVSWSRSQHRIPLTGKFMAPPSAHSRRSREILSFFFP